MLKQNNPFSSLFSKINIFAGLNGLIRLLIIFLILICLYRPLIPLFKTGGTLLILEDMSLSMPGKAEVEIQEIYRNLKEDVSKKQNIKIGRIRFARDSRVSSWVNVFRKKKIL
ncbi:hypothetical protein ACFL35_17570 [Candidatus Riflebacteria bacterium]